MINAVDNSAQAPLGPQASPVGTASQQSTTSRTATMRPKRKFSPKMILGVLVFVLVAVGGAAGFFLTQEGGLDIRQQAATDCAQYHNQGSTCSGKPDCDWHPNPSSCSVANGDAGFCGTLGCNYSNGSCDGLNANCNGRSQSACSTAPPSWLCEWTNSSCSGTVQTGACVNNGSNEKHMGCNSNKQCVEMDGGGPDTCSSHASCDTSGGKHMGCNSNKQCVEMDGDGPDTCSDNSSCDTVGSCTATCIGGPGAEFAFRTCPASFCGDGYAGGCAESAQNLGCYRTTQNCNDDSDCGPNGQCSANGTCVSEPSCPNNDYIRYSCPDDFSGNNCLQNPKSVNGPTEFISPFCGSQQIDCNSGIGQRVGTIDRSGCDGGETHLECQNDQCVSVDGVGENSCGAVGESCGNGGGSHLVCRLNQCVKVPGAGGNQDGCTLQGQDCGTSSPPPSPPTYSCNSACESNDQCKTVDANFVCQKTVNLPDWTNFGSASDNYPGSGELQAMNSFVRANGDIRQHVVRGGRIWYRDISDTLGQWINFGAMEDNYPGSGKLHDINVYIHPDGQLRQHIIRGGRIYFRDGSGAGEWTNFGSVNDHYPGGGEVQSINVFIHPNGQIRQHVVRGNTIWSRDGSNPWRNFGSISDNYPGSGELQAMNVFMHPNGKVRQHVVRGGTIFFRDGDVGQGNCRLASNPTAPNCLPPVGPMCLDIKASVNGGSLTATPSVGKNDIVNFTCGLVAGVNKYEFRVLEPGQKGGPITNLSGNGNVSTGYKVKSTGQFYAQCRICPGGLCQEWEADPRGTTSNPVPSEGSLPPSPVLGTPTPLPSISSTPVVPPASPLTCSETQRKPACPGGKVGCACPNGVCNWVCQGATTPTPTVACTARKPICTGGEPNCVCSGTNCNWQCNSEDI